MGPEHLFTRGIIMDIDGPCQETDIKWGVHVIGGVRVVVSRPISDWDWSNFTCHFAEENHPAIHVSKILSILLLQQVHQNIFVPDGLTHDCERLPFLPYLVCLLDKLSCTST